MTYFPPARQNTPTKCPGCGGWFVEQDGPRLSCCVYHAPGTCCHFGEVPAHPPAPRESPEEARRRFKEACERLLRKVAKE